MRSRAIRGALADEVVVRQDGQAERRRDEAVVELAAGDLHDTGRRRGDLVVERRGDVVLGEPLARALRLAVAGRDEHDAHAGGDPLLDVLERGGGVAAIGRGGLHLDRAGLLVGVEAERRDREPRVAEAEGLQPYVLERAERGRAEVDRRLGTGRRGGPRRLQELLARRHQVGSASPDALRVAQHDRRALGQQVDEELHLVDQHRGQRLHALDGVALGDLGEDLGQRRMRLGELRGARPDLVVEQQLAARRRPHVGDLLERALVGDREPADLVDLVAPELDAERVLLGRREHVDDAAAHRELTAALDQVDARVGRRGQLPRRPRRGRSRRPCAARPA